MSAFSSPLVRVCLLPSSPEYRAKTSMIMPMAISSSDMMLGPTGAHRSWLAGWLAEEMAGPLSGLWALYRAQPQIDTEGGTIGRIVQQTLPLPVLHCSVWTKRFLVLLSGIFPQAGGQAAEGRPHFTVLPLSLGCH